MITIEEHKNSKTGQLILGYVPVLYPDEILYSFLGRVALVNALGSPRSYLKDFFGETSSVSVPDLPSSLNTLQARLGEFSPYASSEDILDRGLYPYHRPFLLPSIDESARRSLLFGNGTGVKTLIGRVANRFGADTPLRFCSLCRVEDFEKYKVRYWHRVHQLPGVRSCCVHGIDLVEYVKQSTSTFRQEFNFVPEASPGDPPTVLSDSTQNWFAAHSAKYIGMNLPSLDVSKRQSVYEDALLQKGFMKKTNRFDYVSLATAIRKHYYEFDGFIHRERLLETQKTPLAWLITLFDRPEKSVHPICHLLLIGFLFDGIDDFIQRYNRGNASRSESLEPVVVEGTISVNDFNIDEESVLRNSNISCTAAANILHLSTTTVSMRRRRLGIAIARRGKSLTSDVLGRVDDALRSGLGIKEIAAKHHISTASVRRRRALLPPVVKEFSADELSRLRDERRSRWRNAVMSSAKSGVKSVRTSNSALYAALYRHDKEWLLKFNKGFYLEVVPSERVDWKKRDAELCESLKVHVSHLRNDPDRPQLTRAHLLRDLNPTMINFNLHKMPKLQAALESSIEVDEAYEIFRVERAIAYLRDRNLPFRMWRVQKIAGFRKLNEAAREYAQRRIIEETAIDLA